jgi:DNA-binding MarR family transcriptional regulator/GNAT superfamily N-acetyltransferase
LSNEERINAVRHFNRFMTRQIGALREGLLHSPYSLTESRILFEIANHDTLTASNLIHELGLDAGYVSRILARFEEKGLVYKERSTTDARQRILKLTTEGVNAFSQLNERSFKEIAELLGELSESEQQKLISAMTTVEGLLSKKKNLKFSGPYFLRQHEPGDMGWVVQQHGILYSKEYGWDESFEALVSQIVADFINNFNPKKERCWIAEMNGKMVGSIFVVEGNEDTAKLRLLIVDPMARGLGLGSQLVEECIQFSRRVGYKKLVLWTNSVLKEARHIYQKKGFKLVNEEKHHSFGQDLVGETWELLL